MTPLYYVNVINLPQDQFQKVKKLCLSLGGVYLPATPGKLSSGYLFFTPEAAEEVEVLIASLRNEANTA